jgi:release factor glutamine methyltransferase
MDVLTPPGVFTPISDSRQLADAVRREPLGKTALDLCTGTGIVALAAAESGARVTAVDVSRKALLAVRMNARRHGRRIHTLRGHLFDVVPGQRFDLITANPPYVPSPDVDLPARGLPRAWAAGPDGRVVLDEICDGAAAHLRPGGVLLLVHSSLVGEQATLDRLFASGLQPEVVERHRGPLGPLMREQQALGTIPADVEVEDVLVIRAVSPGRR